MAQEEYLFSIFPQALQTPPHSPDAVPLAYFGKAPWPAWAVAAARYWRARGSGGAGGDSGSWNAGPALG